MLASLTVELRKLNRSLAALLAVAAPGLIGGFLFLIAMRAQKPMSWDEWMQGAIFLWAFFMLPMCVTALTALLAHMEHAPRTWDHLRALPVPRWRLYAAKAVCAIGVIAAMSAGLLLACWAGGILAGLLRPEIAPTGAFPLAALAKTLSMMLGASVLMIVIQLWVALRFSSFVPALVIGICGTFFAVAATSAQEGAFLPWQMPVNMVAEQAWRVQTALGLGLAGGLAALIAMLAHLAWREAT
jgi:lantibiotic transport system permease protein